MKPQQLAEKTREIFPLLQCPLCQSGFSLTHKTSLVCEKGHCYDFSRKGYINLAPSHNQQAEKYGETLFQSRGQLLEAGFYAPVVQALSEAMEAYAVPRPALLDAGCGEGYYLRSLAASTDCAAMLGVDLSRAAIAAAARASLQAHWLVGDLTRLPLRDGSLDVILNILTPADYREFARVLKPGGLFLKVIPGADYLLEVRRLLSSELRNAEYSNERVVAHLQANAEVLSMRELRYTLGVTPEQARLFLDMTPMSFGVEPSKRPEADFDSITIHLALLCCHMHA